MSTISTISSTAAYLLIEIFYTNLDSPHPFCTAIYQSL